MVSGGHEASHGQHPTTILLAWWVVGGLLGFLNSKFFISLAEVITQNKSNRRNDVGAATPPLPQVISDRRKRTGGDSRLHQVMRMLKDTVV